ncbi:MAG: rRNA maturation RNase YbeY [Acidobacteria bacterium]|nr:rRNA maturation RNase YbeY [Acidobacteriota bacterium]
MRKIIGRSTSSSEIEVINRQRLYRIDKNSAAQLSRATLDRIGRADAVVTIAFIRDHAMRRLNREYRGIDKSTDVLSFAYHESDQFSALGSEADHLGDLVIAVDTAADQARLEGLSFERIIGRLVIHGTLHLAGYDHETDDGRMSRLERVLRKEFL